MTIEEEIRAIMIDLRNYGDVLAENRQRIAALGGAYMAASISAKTPRGKKIHKRYSRLYVNARLKAKKGTGIVLGTYYPGNLQSSIQVLKFRKAKSKVYVGGKLAKGAAKGTFGKAVRTDGYYLHMVNNGTKHKSGRKFMEPAVESAKVSTYKIMLKEYTRVHEKIKKELGL